MGVLPILRRLVPACAALALLCISPARSFAQHPTCERNLVRGLQDAWLHSLAADGPFLLAVDPLALRVVRLSDEGRLTEAFTRLELPGGTTRFAPSLIQGVGNDGEFLLGNGSDQIFEVVPGASVLRPKGSLPEREFRVVSPVTPLTGKNTSGSIIGMYGWAATSESSLIAFVDVKRPDGSYASGFAWLDWRNPDSFELIREVEPTSPETTFYFVLHPYVATIGDKGYFLAMEEVPAIYEFDPKRPEERRLRRLGMPHAFKLRPTLPPNDGTVPMEAFYEALADATTPYGLYAWSGRLWLLGHRVLAKGGTEWVLYGIDPTGPNGPARVVSRVYLPTTAEHLALAFGNGALNALEKGPVKVLGKQDVQSLLRIPRWMVEEESSPLTERGATGACR